MRLQYPAGASENLKGAMKSAYDAVYPATLGGFVFNAVST
jgi:hypothetical protein